MSTQNPEYGAGASQGGMEGSRTQTGMTDRPHPQGAGWGEKVNEKVSDVRSQVQERANRAMDATSRNIDRMAMYFREKDSQEMVQDLQQVIRKHPGKSVVVGLVVGMLLGKILR